MVKTFVHNVSVRTILSCAITLVVMDLYWPNLKTTTKLLHKLIVSTTNHVTTHPMLLMLNQSITIYFVITLSLDVLHVLIVRHAQNVNLDFMHIHIINNWLYMTVNLVEMWLVDVNCVTVENFVNNVNLSI